MCDPKDINEARMVEAMVTYMEKSVSQDFTLRELLAQVQYNDPSLSVEECLYRLVQDFIKIRGNPC